MWKYIANNNDSSDTFEDGSVHGYDSYIKEDLLEGTYLLAISNYYLIEDDALSGRNTNTGYSAGGPYRITFNRALNFISQPN